MQSFKSIKSILLLMLLCFFISDIASASVETEGGNMNSLSSEAIAMVFQKKIYFAHQSVGKNILHGVELLAPDRIEQIVNLQDTVATDNLRAAFYHSRVGSNSDLKSKIDEFSQTVESTFVGKLDIAFVKLCYLDIVASSDIESLFSYYKESLAALRKSYPDIEFVHLTVPLMVENSTWKTQIKKLMGQDHLWEYADNIKRNQYNQMLLNEYKGREPVFDLAMIESTRPDGTRESFTFKGKTYYALVNDYSRDGAHLNDLGSKKVGSALLEFLAEIK
jgi:hypothetical protein